MVSFRPFDHAVNNYVYWTTLILLTCNYAIIYIIPKHMVIYHGLTHTKFWYLKGGHIYPSPSNRSSPLFQNGSGDRIVDQLMYVPDQYEGKHATPKLILTHSTKLGEGGFISAGSIAFKDCPVSKCIITTKKSQGPNADAIIFKGHYVHSNFTRPLQQVWIFFNSKSPPKTVTFRWVDIFNWTATYRSDSDIVVPYGFWYYYQKNVKFKPVNENYAATKKKKVAWLVSNCMAYNNRKEYAEQLSKFIQVDIYGICGSLKCPRKNKNKCFRMLAQEYKFYLAFENSNCREYITEKYFINALQNSIIPIVTREDFARLAPKGSYIHVDDFSSPEDLANYLHIIDKNDTLYNNYFRWQGTGEIIGRYPFFYCRLCAMLHGPIVPKQYENINKWWRPDNICVYKRTWNNYSYNITSREN